MANKSTRLCPVTGIMLHRGIRQVEVCHKGKSTIVELPGWYAPDDAEGAESIHTGADLLVKEDAIRKMETADALEE
jgi:hypothetical protein